MQGFRCPLWMLRGLRRYKTRGAVALARLFDHSHTMTSRDRVRFTRNPKQSPDTSLIQFRYKKEGGKSFCRIDQWSWILVLHPECRRSSLFVSQVSPSSVTYPRNDLIRQCLTCNDRRFCNECLVETTFHSQRELAITTMTDVVSTSLIRLA